MPASAQELRGLAAVSSALKAAKKTSYRRVAVISIDEPGLDRAPKCILCGKRMTSIEAVTETWNCPGHATVEII